MPGLGMEGMTAPAMPAPGAPKPGKEQRGRVLAGLALELLAVALPQLGTQSPEGQEVANVISRLGKKFAKPPADIGQSEMKFMSSQLYPAPKGSAMDSGPGIKQSLMGAGAQPPPAPVPPPGGAPAGGAPPMEGM